MLQIIFEDEYFFAINKRSGIHSASLPNSSTESIAELLLKQNPQASQNSPKPEDAGLINRLDFETSGVLLAAKNINNWEMLHRCFTSSNVNKRYLALVEGKADVQTEVQNFIGTPNRRAKKVKVYEKEPAKSARAQFAHSKFILKKYFKDLDISLVEIIAYTGRRHQIRAHAKHLGHSLLGDKLYGSERSLDLFLKNSSKMPEFFLHAHIYEFINPFTEKKINIQAALPSAFSDCISAN